MSINKFHLKQGDLKEFITLKFPEEEDNRSTWTYVHKTSKDVFIGQGLIPKEYPFVIVNPVFGDLIRVQFKDKDIDYFNIDVIIGAYKTMREDGKIDSVAINYMNTMKGKFLEHLDSYHASKNVDNDVAPADYGVKDVVDSCKDMNHTKTDDVDMCDDCSKSFLKDALLSGKAEWFEDNDEFIAAVKDAEEKREDKKFNQVRIKGGTRIIDVFEQE